MRHTISIYTFLLTCLTWQAASAAITLSTQEARKLSEINSGRLVDCSAFRPGTNPSLNFEILGSNALVNESSKQLSLQLKVVFYRCHLENDGESSFTVVEPSSPYQYEFEQLDGTRRTIKVKEQKYRFGAMIGQDESSNDITKSSPARVDKDRLVQAVRVDLPIQKLLTADQKKNLKRGKSIQLSIRMLGALSAEYSVDSQSYDESGFKPVNNFFWNVKLTTNASGDIKAELLKLEASNL